MTLATPSAGERVSLTGVSWELYQHMLREVGNANVRLTYDEGRLEIMSPSGFHELVKKILGRLIEAYCDALGIPLEGFGSTTFDRETLRKGLEPDECYYIANAPKMIGRREFDWEIDPPPDLAIEVDISPPAVARQPIYAALGVPEIWRFDGEALTVHHLGLRGKYQQRKHSRAFPFLPMPAILRFLKEREAVDETTLLHSFQEWVQSTLAPSHGKSPKRKDPSRGA